MHASSRKTIVTDQLKSINIRIYLFLATTELFIRILFWLDAWFFHLFLIRIREICNSFLLARKGLIKSLSRVTLQLNKAKTNLKTKPIRLINDYKGELCFCLITYFLYFRSFLKTQDNLNRKSSFFFSDKRTGCDIIISARKNLFYRIATNW